MLLLLLHFSPLSVEKSPYCFYCLNIVVVIIHYSLLHKTSEDSVVFNFNTSLSACIPSVSIPFSVVQVTIHFFLPPSLCFDFFTHFSDQVLSKWCSHSAFHSVLLPLHLQSHYLLKDSFVISFSLSSSLPWMVHILNLTTTLRCSLLAFHSLPFLLLVQWSSLKIKTKHWKFIVLFQSFFFFLRLMSSDVSALFTFKDSLNAFAPSSPILLSVSCAMVINLLVSQYSLYAHVLSRL